jgi:hypothetical protein
MSDPATTRATLCARSCTWVLLLPPASCDANEGADTRSLDGLGWQAELAHDCAMGVWALDPQQQVIGPPQRSPWLLCCGCRRRFPHALYARRSSWAAAHPLVPSNGCGPAAAARLPPLPQPSASMPAASAACLPLPRRRRRWSRESSRSRTLMGWQSRQHHQRQQQLAQVPQRRARAPSCCPASGAASVLSAARRGLPRQQQQTQLGWAMACTPPRPSRSSWWLGLGQLPASCPPLHSCCSA